MNTGDLTESQLLEVLMLSKTATAIYTTDDIIIQMANDAMLAFWGKDKSIIGKPLEEGVPELKGQPFNKLLQRVLRTGITNSGIAPAQTRINGELQTHYYEYEYRPIMDGNGVPYCILHTATNVTANVLGEEAIQRAKEQEEALSREYLLNERLAATNEELTVTNEALRKAQEDLYQLNNELEERVAKRSKDLIESEGRFLSMADSSGLLIASADVSGNVIYFSKAWVEFTGRSLANLLQFGWVDLVHPEDQDDYLDSYFSAFKMLQPFTEEFRMRNAQGNYRWLLANGQARFLPDGTFTGYISSCVDITDLKEAEVRKEEFISVASHELRTPLTALKGFIQLMDQTKTNPLNPMLPKFIEQANKSMDKIIRLVENLLNYSRTEAKGLELNKTLFVMADLLESCCSQIKASGKHEIIFKGDRQLRVRADENAIEQVVVNLLNNAAKYASDGKDITFFVEKVGDWAKISITDKGPGIPTEKMPHLFDRYYRGDYSGRQYSGLGLGLHISANIIKRHGGQIGVESQLGNGATFWFTLPL